MNPPLNKRRNCRSYVPYIKSIALGTGIGNSRRYYTKVWNCFVNSRSNTPLLSWQCSRPGTEADNQQLHLTQGQTWRKEEPNANVISLR
jgi:hypothetical protein